MADYRRNVTGSNGGRIRNRTINESYQSARHQSGNRSYQTSRNYSAQQRDLENNGYTYTSGNTIRKVEPAYSPPEKVPQKRRRKNLNVRPKRKIEPGVMTGKYTLFLSVISCVLLFTCFQYLSIRSDVSSKKSQITNLQKNVSNLKMDNDASLGIVNQTVNMESVRQRADELGMVFMEREQLISYKAPSEEIMKQYNGIPSSGVVAQYDRAYE